MTTARLTIIELNARFQRLTWMQVKLDFWAESQWFEWSRYFPDDPFTAADLDIVVGYIRRHQGKNGGYTSGSLTFSRLIGQPDRFLEIRGLARAETRKPAPTPRDQVLQQTGRPIQDTAPARSAASILAGQEALKRLLAVRDNL